MPSIFSRERWSQNRYSDLRDHTKSDPERARQLELDWYMERYERWRSLYTGTALEETISSTEDTDSSSAQDSYRWPVRFNLIRSYCLLYAGMLWGRARTGHESSDLFDIRVDPKAPSGQNATVQAQRLTDALTLFWKQFYHKLRPCGVIQQWAGGCVLKVSWNPFSPMSVMGVLLETIQPEHFYPIWNPLNVDELIAVRIKFGVPKEVAQDIYGLTDAEVKPIVDGTAIPVEEHWDRKRYYVRLGRGQLGIDKDGIVGRVRAGPRDEWVPLEGDNPIRHPAGYGMIPFVYIPRLGSGGFFGESLAHDLEGIQEEMNKTLADFGDALLRGSHPTFGISDYRGPDRRSGVIAVPRHGALNLGTTPAGQSPPKIHNFPAPSVPAQTPEFADRLLSLSEQAVGLTPAARGATGTGSGLARALEMLPTNNLIDWQRAHWTHGLAGRNGIHELVSCMWAGKARDVPGLPQIEPTAIALTQAIEYRPVVPRERTEVIDEVVRLYTAKTISPWEALRRLGDVEKVGDEVAQLAWWLSYMARMEAAVAGRAVEITSPTNLPTPATALPEVSGDTDRPKSKPAPTEPEGMSKGGDRENG